MVGGGSCRLSFFFPPPSSTFHFSTCLMVGSWSTSTFISLLVCYFVHYSFSNQAIKNMHTCANQNTSHAHASSLCWVFWHLWHQSAVIWHRLSYEPRRLNLWRCLCNRDSHFTGVTVSRWPSEWVSKEMRNTWAKKSTGTFFAQSEDLKHISS